MGNIIISNGFDAKPLFTGDENKEHRYIDRSFSNRNVRKLISCASYESCKKVSFHLVDYNNYNRPMDDDRDGYHDLSRKREQYLY